MCLPDGALLINLWHNIRTCRLFSESNVQSARIFRSQCSQWEAEDTSTSPTSMNIEKRKFSPFSSSAQWGGLAWGYQDIISSTTPLLRCETSIREKNCPALELMEHEVDLSYKCWCNQRTPITCEMQTVHVDDNGAGGTWGHWQQQITGFLCLKTLTLWAK